MWETPPSVIVSWRDRQPTAENYLLGTAYEITADILQVLCLCSSPKSTEELVRDLNAAGYDITIDELAPQLATLHDQGLLQVPDTCILSKQLQQSVSWVNWGPEAQYFHFATKDAPYLEFPGEEREYVAEILSDCQPPLFKRYPNAIRIPLPRVAQTPPRVFIDVLQCRRTTREFEDAALPLDDVAAILHHAFAPQKFIDAGAFGVLPYRNYANAGARSEMEIYVNVLKVIDLDPGLYHYNVVEHSLEYLREALSREQILHLTYQQTMCSDAHVGIFVTAVVDRMGHKYRHPRSLRAMYYDVGHLGQTFALVATLYGFGPCQTAALRDREVENFLGVDGIKETVLYYLGMGIPAKEAVTDITKSASLAAMQKTTLFQDQ
jgi:SagB-type dehydrogenase family enzyme